jgi:hypothetical protein
MELRSNQRPKFSAAPKQSQVPSRILAGSEIPLYEEAVYLELTSSGRPAFSACIIRERSLVELVAYPPIPRSEPNLSSPLERMVP